MSRCALVDAALRTVTKVLLEGVVFSASSVLSLFFGRCSFVLDRCSNIDFDATSHFHGDE
jgi:hypothetical protein